MTNRKRGVAGTLAVLGAAILSACQGGLESAQTAPLETDGQKASYAVGLQMGNQIAVARDHISLDAFVRGVQDALAERDPVITPDSMQAVMTRFSQMIQEEQSAENAAAAERNETEGAAYRETNAAKEGVTTTESGLQYEVLRAGDGARPSATDQVRIHYKGTLIDGTEFDSSYDGDPVSFSVTGVIAGFAEALQLMPVGSHYRFVIPGNLAYGPQGSGQIPPNATLIFEIEMLEILQ